MAKRTPGRPSHFTQNLADLICERICDGESLRSICSNESMPGRTTVFRWLAEIEDFRNQYARAREIQADTLFEEILEIADDSTRDTITKEGRDGESYETANSEWINRSRLRVDARKWMASKLAPKKYGERITHTGDEGAPIPLVLNGSDVHG